MPRIRQLALASVALALASLALPAAALAGAPRVAPVTDLPASISFPGKLLGASGWTDANGRNIVVFSAKESSRHDRRNDVELASRYLYVTHVVLTGGKARQLRQVKDKVERCEFDLTAAFVDEAFAVTDLDDDGVAEVSFAYKLSCRSDVSPATLKLLVLEGGKKYILRGTTRVDAGGGERFGGEHAAEPSPRKWPVGFHAHAEGLWAKVVEERW